jgi:hypothetical protein
VQVTRCDCADRVQVASLSSAALETSVLGSSVRVRRNDTIDVPAWRFAPVRRKKAICAADATDVTRHSGLRERIWIDRIDEAKIRKFAVNG